MANDTTDRIAELRDEVDVEAQRFERARQRVGERAATDASGAVRLRTDADGLVVEVTVDARWRDRLQPEALAAAVLEAYANGVAERSRAWAEDFADDTQEEPRPRPAPGLESSVAAELFRRLQATDGDADPGPVMERLVQLLEDLDRRLDDALDRAEQMGSREYSGQSSSRHVRARVSGGGELVGVEYDARWLPGAHSFNIGRETTEAIHAALRELAEGQATEPDPMGELLRLADDPAALADYLGIH